MEKGNEFTIRLRKNFLSGFLKFIKVIFFPKCHPIPRRIIDASKCAKRTCMSSPPNFRIKYTKKWRIALRIRFISIVTNRVQSDYCFNIFLILACLSGINITSYVLYLEERSFSISLSNFYVCTCSPILHVNSDLLKVRIV